MKPYENIAYSALPADPRLKSRGALALACLKKYAVFFVALFAAAVTCVFVPIDAEYGGYFDLQTLACLWCTMAVVGAFKNIHFFEAFAQKLLRRFKTARSLVIALVAVTYAGSMVLANDMALLTFLPLGFFALRYCRQSKYMAFTFIMQNVAANLGGMLTPFGNPQNLYLFSYYHIPTAEFFAAMAFPFCVALVGIVGVCFFVKPVPLTLDIDVAYRPSTWRSLCYAALFVLSVLIVFRVFPYYWGLLAVIAALLALDFRAFLRVDYALLLTFCAFFVFSGNLARIGAVRELMSGLVEWNTLLVGTLACQVISNVPTSILLSHFTQNWRGLLVAVNIGGLGTPIASLASLITLSEYRRIEPNRFGHYMRLFSLINFAFLAVLFGAQVLFEFLL